MIDSAHKLEVFANRLLVEINYEIRIVAELQLMTNNPKGVCVALKRKALRLGIIRDHMGNLLDVKA
jgi:hypothetical protein